MTEPTPERRQWLRGVIEACHAELSGREWQVRAQGTPSWPNWVSFTTLRERSFLATWEHRAKPESRQTPAEFADTVRTTIADTEGDKEVCHGQTDALMEGLLESLGYGEAVELIRETTRWTA